jgi:hypothetical protein
LHAEQPLETLANQEVVLGNSDSDRHGASICSAGPPVCAAALPGAVTCRHGCLMS